jgi:hypothetical protein
VRIDQIRSEGRPRKVQAAVDAKRRMQKFDVAAVERAFAAA